MAENSAPVNTDVTVLHLRFETREEQALPFGSFVLLFESLDSIIELLAFSADGPSQPQPEVYVVDLEMHSPLQVGLALVNFTKEKVGAILAVMQNIIYFHQEADRRGALAAQEWEEVYRRRLENVASAVQIAQSLDAADPKVAQMVQHLLEPLRKVQGSPARLVDVAVEGDDPNEEFTVLRVGPEK